MVVDTSVLIAILNAEPEASRFLDMLGAVEASYISAGSLLECGIVVGSKFGPEGLEVMEQFCADVSLATVPVDAAQARLGYLAFQRFGKGSHPAKLNFGDCFAYALAKSRNLPLLFKGEDFALTDITIALKG